MQPVRSVFIAIVLCALKLLTARLAQSVRAYEQHAEH
jgi:hypothetical protein